MATSDSSPISRPHWNRERQTTSTSPYLTNPNFLVTVIHNPVGKPPVIVNATAPDSFDWGFNTNFGTPFAFNALRDGLAADVYSGVTGKRLVSQVSTLKVWQGGQEDVEFTVPLLFHAWSDTAKDVLNPINALMEMCMPKLTENGFLQSPGPFLTEDGLKYIVGGVAGKVDAALKLLEGTTIADVAGAVGGALGNVGSFVVDSGNAFRDGFNNQTPPKNTNVHKPAQSMVDGGTQVINSVRKRADELAGNLGLNKGNTFASIVKSKLQNTISVQIGRWFFLDSCVVSDIQLTAKPQTVYSKDGALTMVTASMRFYPVTLLTASDMREIFKGGL